MNEWECCEVCDSEFKIVTTSDEKISYCPFCGSDIEIEQPEEDDYWDEDDE